LNLPGTISCDRPTTASRRSAEIKRYLQVDRYQRKPPSRNVFLKDIAIAVFFNSRSIFYKHTRKSKDDKKPSTGLGRKRCPCKKTFEVLAGYANHASRFQQHMYLPKRLPPQPAADAIFSFFCASFKPATQRFNYFDPSR
jgi:hypothetical protein